MISLIEDLEATGYQVSSEWWMYHASSGSIDRSVVAMTFGDYLG
jgi:hypothetical protein